MGSKLNPLKLITLNIEGNFHLDKVINLIKKEGPDVVCLQEVFKEDVDYLRNTLEMYGEFAPMVSIKYEETTYLPPKGEVGLLILTKEKPKEFRFQYYVGSDDRIPIYSGTPNSGNRALLKVKLVKGGAEFNIITTHFTWSPKGSVTPLQRENLEEMLKILDENGEFVLCGDFNAPRGKEIYGKLAKLYTDNIPPEVKTTMDPKLHRVKNLEYVVDGIFSSPKFKVEGVKAVPGVSDHQALTALVSKV